MLWTIVHYNYSRNGQYISTKLCLYYDAIGKWCGHKSTKPPTITIQAHESMGENPSHQALATSVMNKVRTFNLHGVHFKISNKSLSCMYNCFSCHLFKLNNGSWPSKIKQLKCYLIIHTS
jgi:hypothetical protein